MKNLDVSHDVDTFSEALGISDERAKELGEVVWENMEKKDNISESLDYIWNELSETTTFSEKIYLTFKAGLKVGLEKGFKKGLSIHKQEMEE